MATVFVTLWLVFCLNLNAQTRPTLDFSPNFIIFMIDDIEYTSDWNYSSPSGTILDNGKIINYFDIPTPNIQSIINEGIVIPRSYAGAPICSASRYALLTGRQPVRSENAIHRTLSSSSGYQGTNVTLYTCSALSGNDTINNIQTLLKSHKGYHTGMVGKYHLLNPATYGCNSLTDTPNNTLYNLCKDLLIKHGFDMIDAWYFSNIKSNPYFSHNPEWIVDRAQYFINQSINILNKPFFLYFAHTLSHSPDMQKALLNYTYNDTPKGTLIGHDIPSNTGMLSRDNIWNKTLSYGHTKSFLNNIIAGTIWVDDSIGAMIQYLKNNNIYNNTFIIVTNDHGQGAKGTLYEHGSRIFQYIRFPPLFQHYYLPNDFITSNVDLAAVIYDIIGINNTNIDGKSWLTDVLDEINDNSINYPPNCCEYRYVDIFNSHAIIGKEWKYIYRATNNVQTTDNVDTFYAHCYDEEQIYNLYLDPNEQYNQINNVSIIDIICNFKQLMVEYIQNVACPINYCKVPETNVLCSITSIDPTIQPSYSMTSTNTDITIQPSSYPVILTKSPTLTTDDVSNGLKLSINNIIIFLMILIIWNY
eukprot:255441_1